MALSFTSTSSLPIIEICCDSYASVVNAIEGGAKRIELCSALDVDGLTPSCGLLTRACHVGALHNVPINVLIRARSGDFTYTNEEIDMMLDDVRMAKRCGAAGIVFGALTEDYKIDLKTTSEFVDLARSLKMTFTFHRAFDLCLDIMASLQRLIHLNVDRLLTSGCASKAEEGTSAICRCVEKVKEERSNLIIMAGGGITKDNILMILRSTGVEELHGSFKMEIDSIVNANLIQPAVPNFTDDGTSSPNRRYRQHEELTNHSIIKQKRNITSKEKVIEAMRVIGYTNFTRIVNNMNSSPNSNTSKRKSFITTTNTNDINNMEFILLRNREHLVRIREKELQRLCYAVENISNKNGITTTNNNNNNYMNNNELKQLRKENMKLYQKNLSLLETINLNSKEFNYLKHQNREYEILNNELRQTAVRNVGFININSSNSSSNNNNGNYSNKDMEQGGDDEENLTTVAPSSTINIMDFNNLLHTQGELRSEIHKLRLLKNELDKKCRHYEKSLKHLQHNKDDIDAVEESKMIKLTKNRHLLEINALQSSEKKLKKENLKFLKKLNDIKAVLRAKDKEHAKEIDSIQEILNSKELRIKDLIKKLKKEKSMTKYLNTRIEEASLLRHELQKEHENEILQNNSVIGQLQSKVTQLKFSNSINNEYDVDITINNVGNANSSIISNVERTTTFNLSDSNYPDIIAGSSNVKDNNNNYKEKEEDGNDDDDDNTNNEISRDMIDEAMLLKSQLENVRAKTKQIVQQAQSLVSEKYISIENDDAEGEEEERNNNNNNSHGKKKNKNNNNTGSTTSGGKKSSSSTINNNNNSNKKRSRRKTIRPRNKNKK